MRICAQARRLLHISNLFYTESQIKAAELIVRHSFGDKVFFCNSGAEANEAAIKLVRRYSWKNHGEGRADDRGHGELFPRTDHCHPVGHGAAEVPGGVQPDGRGLQLRAVQRHEGNRESGLGEDLRSHHRVHPVGRRRLRRRSAVHEEAERVYGRAGHPARLRRSADGHGQDGQALRIRALRYRARHHEPGEGAGQRLPGGRNRGQRQGDGGIRSRARTPPRSAATRSPPRPSSRPSTP